MSDRDYFDHFLFCQAMAVQTDAEIWRVRVTEAHANRIETTQGPGTGKFVGQRA